MTTRPPDPGPVSPDDERRALSELLAAYALDAVDDVERRRLERLVSADTELAAELSDYLAVAAELGTAEPSEPSPAVRAAVLAALDHHPQLPAGAADGHRRSARTPLRWAVAAAAAVVIAAVPSVLAWQEHQSAVQAEARADALAEALAEPGARLVQASVAGGGTAAAVLTDERAVLVADGLRELDADQVYQLWALDPEGSAAPAGFVPTSGVVDVARDVYRAGDALALTVEPAGGSRAPTTEPLVVLGG